MNLNPTRNPLRSARGFSLVELCMVVVVIGVVLGFGLPAFHKFRTDAALPGSTRQIVSAMKLARQLAISRSHPYAIKVDAANARFQSYDPDVGLGATWQNLGQSVSVSSVTSPATGGVFQFDYQGCLASSGQVVLRSAQGAQDTITVNLSGRVSGI